MPTYYKYAERSAESQINWAEVGRDMSDMLRDETKIREEKKAAIDAASREFGKVLSDPPQGEHTGASAFTLKYADNASQFLKMQDQLLKSGQMKIKDYTISRQNLTDGTDVAFNLVKNYQKFYGEKMERYRTDKSQDLEQWLMGQSEIYSNFNKNDLYINPTDGTVSVAEKELKKIDGKDVYVMNKNPNKFATVSTINNWITGKYDKFNTNAAADAFVGALGDELRATTTEVATLTKTGKITTIADITSRTDIDPDTKKILFKFIDAENQGIKSAFANDLNRLSTVTNSVKFCSANGKQYTFTRDETDAKNNPEKILLKVDPSSNQPTPVFSDVQIKDSDNFMRNEFRRRYDYKEDVKVTPQLDRNDPRALTEAEFKNQAITQEADAIAETVNNVLTGNPAVAKAAIDEINTRPGINARKVGNKIIVDISNPENGNPIDTETITLDKSGTISSTGMALAKLVNPEMNAGKVLSSLKRKGQGKSLNLNSSAESGKVGFVEPVLETPLDAYSKQINKILIPEIIPEKSNKNKVEFSNILNKTLQPLGIKVTPTFGMSKAIYLTDSKGTQSSPIFLGDTKKIMETIKEWSLLHPTDKLNDLIKKGIIPSGTSKSATTGAGTVTGGVIR